MVPGFWGLSGVRGRFFGAQTSRHATPPQFAFQLEQGESGTIHYQGLLKLKIKKRFSFFKNDPFTVTWHVEPMKGTWEEARAYCTKIETRVRGPWVFPRPPRFLKYDQLLMWQKVCSELMTHEPDDRTIVWFADLLGGAGKTQLTRHLVGTFPDDVLLVGGRGGDIRYMVAQFVQHHGRGPRMIIYNLTRERQDWFQYGPMEELKDGVFASNKYESTMVMIDHPHIVVFANFEPDTSKMTSDRWLVLRSKNDWLTNRSKLLTDSEEDPDAAAAPTQVAEPSTPTWDDGGVGPANDPEWDVPSQQMRRIEPAPVRDTEGAYMYISWIPPPNHTVVRTPAGGGGGCAARAFGAVRRRAPWGRPPYNLNCTPPAREARSPHTS